MRLVPSSALTTVDPFEIGKVSGELTAPMPRVFAECQKPGDRRKSHVRRPRRDSIGKPIPTCPPWEEAQVYRPLRRKVANGLKGRIRVPGDKSMSHRALMLGAVAIGETRITGLLEAEDVLNTAQGHDGTRRRASGRGRGVWHVQGVGVSGLEPPGALDFGNSGTGVRLALGAHGDDADRRPLHRRCLAVKRPMGRVTAP